MSGDWSEWGNHVLREIERLDKCVGVLDDRVDGHDRDFIKIDMRTGFIGLASGMIPVVITILIIFISGGTFKSCARPEHKPSQIQQQQGELKQLREDLRKHMDQYEKDRYNNNFEREEDPHE